MPYQRKTGTTKEEMAREGTEGVQQGHGIENKDH